MKSKLLFLLLFLINANIGLSQNTIGTIFITEDAFEAYTLVSVNTKAYLINNCGEVIREWNSSYLPGNSVYLLPNGNLLRCGRLNDGSSNIGFGGQGGIVELFDWDDNLIWSYTYSSNEFRQHHDVYPMPNGNVMILAATVIPGADAIQSGRDPSLLTEGSLYNERVFEVEPMGSTGGNVVWEWNAIDHVIQDFDNSKDNFGNVGASPEKIDINFLNGKPGESNWLHINSIQYDEERDQIVLSSRNLCEIWIIDHSTTTAESASDSGGIYGKGGDLLYRWGNPQSYDQGLGIDQKLFGQHFPYIIPSGLPNEGKIIVFNNGFNRAPLFSQVDIISPPTSSPGFYDYTPGTAYGPTSTDYTYPETPPAQDSEFYSAIVSSAQQLPNGNILVCEGREAVFFELDQNNNKVWEYILPISNVDGSSYPQTGPPPINSFAFRAIKYGLDHPAFDGRDLTPGLPLETNPDLSACQTLNTSDEGALSFSIYPNPTKDIINIKSFVSIDKVEVFNVMGKKIGETAGNSVDLSDKVSGVYFLKIYSNSIIQSKKVIKK